MSLLFIQIVDLVWMVIPMRDVVAVERLNQPNTLPNGLLFSTRSLNNTIIFANLADREATMKTISGFLGDGAAHFKCVWRGGKGGGRGEMREGEGER